MAKKIKKTKDKKVNEVRTSKNSKKKPAAKKEAPKKALEKKKPVKKVESASKNSIKEKRLADKRAKALSKKTKASAKKNQKKKSITEHIIRGSISPDAPIIKVNNLTKKFSNFVALNKINFEIRRGERIGIIGGNGAGKTTLTEIIAGINKPSSGTITYGFEFESSPKERLGMQFQQSDYPSGLTVKDIVLFARNLRKLTISQEELFDLLKIFQMEEFYFRKVRSLSGGQRQKLNILLSIIHNPRLLILDELSTGLDISAREDIIKFTNDLLNRRKMTSIVISHHMEEIKALCDRVIILDRGKIDSIMSVKDIEKKYGSLSEYARKVIIKTNAATLKDEASKGNNKLAKRLAREKKAKARKSTKTNKKTKIKKKEGK